MLFSYMIPHKEANSLTLITLCPHQNASKDWISLDNDIKNSKTLSFFKAKLKTL